MYSHKKPTMIDFNDYDFYDAFEAVFSYDPPKWSKRPMPNNAINPNANLFILFLKKIWSVNPMWPNHGYMRQSMKPVLLMVVQRDAIIQTNKV